MKRLIRKAAGMFVVFVLISAGFLGLHVGESLAVGEVATDYTKLPEFLETGLNPNLLLVIDNSASMYDPAYVDAGGVGYCSDDSYDSAVAYAGYFDNLLTSWYVYDQTGTGEFVAQSETDAKAVCSGATGTHYSQADLCLTIDESVTPHVVMAFAARGGLLNWLTVSKFDIEKAILTGGKYNASKEELVLETRGCLGKRFIKEVPVTSGGTTYGATFGVRPPDEDEQVLDRAHNGSLSNTRIEVFRVDPLGFVEDRCNDAIDAFLDSSGVGNISVPTGDCLGDASASINSFNFIMQECWYYGEFGHWQPGNSSLITMKTACENVYDAQNPPVLAADLTTTYKTVGAPQLLPQAEVCSGQYSNDIEARYGYVGRCWEPTYTEDMDWVDKACNPATDVPNSAAGGSPYCAADNLWYICSGNYNNGNCTGNPGNWVVQQVGVPTGAPGALASVDWTNDNYYVDAPDDLTLAADADGDRCVYQAMTEYCGNVDQATVVDPSDEVSASAAGAAIPSVLVDYAAVSQLGAPLLAMKGRVKQVRKPVGLIHEFKYNLRIGAMAFNLGTKAECEPVQDSSGKWVASIYDCLQDKGAEIHAGSLPIEILPDGSGTKVMDGGQIIAYIDEGRQHTTELADALNAVKANTWTPTAEAMYSAVGYYTQNATTDLRINPPTGDPTIPGERGDYIRDSDWQMDFGDVDRGSWAKGATYAVDDIVWTSENLTYNLKLYRAKTAGISAASSWNIESDTGVQWMPYDPVLAGCQQNNILLITDGASSADINAKMRAFITGPDNNDGDTASTWTATMNEPGEYECKSWIDGTSGTAGAYDAGETIVSKYFGSTLLDDITAYGQSDESIFAIPAINGIAKEPINTHIVVAGTLRDDGTTNECNAEVIMEAAALNGQEADPDVTSRLVQAADPSQLEAALRAVFERTGGEVSSGSAASVIAHSRSGEGAMYQAIFYPKQLDSDDNEVGWTGDVHALWLDAAGNIREDCGSSDMVAGATACAGAGDLQLDPSKDFIVEFYTDSQGTARARRFIDANGDGTFDNSAACSNTDYDNEVDCLDNSAIWGYAANLDFVADGIQLNDLQFIWSAADWLADVDDLDVLTHRDYGDITKERHIFTMLPDDINQPVNDSNPPVTVPFTTTELSNALGTKYSGYFNAVSSVDPTKHRTANGIVDFIRGKNMDAESYRSRQIDWTDNPGLETVKLGDVVHSTPTLVGSPSENFDLVYGDPTYRAFRKFYQNRRLVIYAGGNDGGMHAFNGGWYDRFNHRFEKSPPDLVVGDPPVTTVLKDYDMGAELWMYVPKNIFPHLRWLTEMNYGDNHVYYIDAKPYIFDAKIFDFDPDDPNDIHPGGWGTIMVGGMRYGGGNIGVDTDGDNVDNETMRSAYFILDITNPEYPPVVLAEFTSDDLGFTFAKPNAIPMLRCDKNTVAGLDDCNAVGKNWPMDWYLAFGSGPHDAELAPAGPQAGMQGLSDQPARIYVMKLGGTETADLTPASLPNVGTGQVDSSGVVLIDNPPILADTYPRSLGFCRDPSKTDEAACSDAGEVWNPVVCEEQGYKGWLDKLTCEGNGAVWVDLGGRCTHWKWNSSEAICTDHGYRWIPSGSGICKWDQPSCQDAGKIWDVLDSKCIEYKTAADCTADGGYAATGTTQGRCSSPSYTEEGVCMSNGAIWTRTMNDSFFGDIIAVDYDLSFQVDSLYFGSVTNTRDSAAHSDHQGAMHRLVVNNDPDPTNWNLNLFYDTRSPVTAAPSVATDGERAWIFFGTGRFMSGKEDKAITWSHPDGTWFLGLKEAYDSDGHMDLYGRNGGMLFDVSDVWVENATGQLSATVKAKNVYTNAEVNLAAQTFLELNDEIGELDGSDLDKYHGWKIKLESGERVVGQPAILGEIVTYTSYIPSADPCIPQGDSYLWAVYYRTGTAYMRSVIGLESDGATDMVLRRVHLGKGLSTTPNIHSGSADGTKAFVQSSTGAIISVEQDNPGAVKSGMQSWRELGESRHQGVCPE
ncbi:MAG: hypothetical protein ABFS18_09015 [Thermodesulfobacteriota bacterium]